MRWMPRSTCCTRACSTWPLPTPRGTVVGLVSAGDLMGLAYWSPFALRAAIFNASERSSPRRRDQRAARTFRGSGPGRTQSSRHRTRPGAQLRRRHHTPARFRHRPPRTGPLCLGVARAGERGAPGTHARLGSGQCAGLRRSRRPGGGRLFRARCPGRECGSGPRRVRGRHLRCGGREHALAHV